jgi:5-methylcytosine-specific restriction endonuclease McrA
LSWHLLRADPHRHGPGKVHVLENGRTRCGKVRVNCPGQEEHADDLDFVDCKGCLNSLEAERRRQEQQRQWERQRAEREARRQRENREWWAWYDGYLESDEWRQRRQRVLRRAGGVCEGCGERTANQVHHLTYDRVGGEMLFDLVAVCDSCHRRIHMNRKAA